MKKFDRLPPEKRKEEIQAAALTLFNEKGFAATTMENIVERVSLSKGGVYRIYASTSDILCDLMLNGMRYRNTYYQQCVEKILKAGKVLTLSACFEMMLDSLLLYPEISKVYVEFLWEKQRNSQLEALYQDICARTREETENLLCTLKADALFEGGSFSMKQAEDFMNAAILSLHVLNLQADFAAQKDKIIALFSTLIQETPTHL